MGQYLRIEAEGMSEFFKAMEKAGNGDFKKELQKFLEGLGNEFLRIVEDEIIRRNVMDTRLLLNSFHKTSGEDGMTWTIEDGGMSLEIGTNVKYAAYVNNGHWMNPEGVNTRFVPGDVVTDSDGTVIKFTYRKGANTGIMLKQNYINGKHYWESSIRILDKMMPKLIEAKVQQWIDDYFERWI